MKSYNPIWFIFTILIFAIFGFFFAANASSNIPHLSTKDTGMFATGIPDDPYDQEVFKIIAQERFSDQIMMTKILDKKSNVTCWVIGVDTNLSNFCIPNKNL